MWSIDNIALNNMPINQIIVWFYKYIYMILDKAIFLISILIVCVIWDYLQDRAITAENLRKVDNQKLVVIEKQKKLEKLVHGHANTYEQGEYHRQLYEIFYSGVPDKYDIHGNKIQGIKPNPQKAMDHLIAAFKLTRNWNYLLKIAKLNHQGMYDMKPNMKYAKQYYQSLVKMCPSGDIRQEALEGLNNIQTEEHEIYVYGWLNLNRPSKTESHLPANKGPLRTNINNIYRANDTLIEDDYNITAVILDGLNPQQPPQLANANNKSYNDPHNTHNSQVLSTIADSLRKLKEQTTITRDKAQSIQEIKEYILKLAPNDKKRDALKALETIQNSVIPLGFCDMKDSDALTLVWNRINDQQVHKDNNQLKETLFEELASMQEHDKTVCPTGRLTRIVDTLNVVDPLVSIRPTYAINGEMMTKAADIRTKLLSTRSEDDRKALEEGTSPQQDDFQKILQDTIKEQLHKDYVESDILSKEKFDNELNKWINEI